VIMEAYVHGVSTRSVDDLVAAMGVQAGGIQVGGLEDLRRPGQGDRGVSHPQFVPHTEFPYVFCDATFCKVRIGLMWSLRRWWWPPGCPSTATREVLGTAVGDSESYEFWREFLASLRARGLTGVHLVISDAHAGLKAAVAQQFTGSSWQRCRCTSCAICHTAVSAKHARR